LVAARLESPKNRIIDASYKMPGLLPLASDDISAGIFGRGVPRCKAIADANASAGRTMSREECQRARRGDCWHFLRYICGRWIMASAIAFTSKNTAPEYAAG